MSIPTCAARLLVVPYVGPGRRQEPPAQETATAPLPDRERLCGLTAQTTAERTFRGAHEPNSRFISSSRVRLK